jgi:hypothetical protein
MFYGVRLALTLRLAVACAARRKTLAKAAEPSAGKVPGMALTEMVEISINTPTHGLSREEDSFPRTYPLSGTE